MIQPNVLGEMRVSLWICNHTGAMTPHVLINDVSLTVRQGILGCMAAFITPCTSSQMHLEHTQKHTGCGVMHTYAVSPWSTFSHTHTHSSRASKITHCVINLYVSFIRHFEDGWRKQEGEWTQSLNYTEGEVLFDQTKSKNIVFTMSMLEKKKKLREIVLFLWIGCFVTQLKGAFDWAELV